MTVFDENAHTNDSLRSPMSAYHEHVARWVHELVCTGTYRSPFIVGISGPQGGGKSTLATAVQAFLTGKGWRTFSFSVDDLYLTHSQQIALAKHHPKNRFMEFRGYPGTHDTKLGKAILKALRSKTEPNVIVPVYEKGAFDGRGDRAPEDKWREVPLPLDVVIFEGWMLGFEPLRTVRKLDTLGLVDLKVPNKYLADYRHWNNQLDAFVHLVAHDLNDIVDWRIDAERARRDTIGGLTDEQARDYIERFLPAYRVYVPQLLDSPPHCPWLRVRLGKDRNPTDYESIIPSA